MVVGGQRRVYEAESDEKPKSAARNNSVLYRCEQ